MGPEEESNVFWPLANCCVDGREELCDKKLCPLMLWFIRALKNDKKYRNLKLIN
jgi:hypothetical protein